MREDVQNHKLRLLAFVSIIIIGIMCIAAFLIFLFTKFGVSIQGEGIIGSLVTAISIIVALGIGYSMMNVYSYSNKVEELEQSVNSLEIKFREHSNSVDEKIDNVKKEVELTLGEERTQTNEKILDLQFNNLIVRKVSELNKRNMGASSMFGEGDLLMAIKTEYDILRFIFENFDYLESEFDSSIGSKRSLIANDLLRCIKIIDSKYMEQTSAREFTKIVKAIFSNIQYLTMPDILSKMNKYEQERYCRLFNNTEEILSQMMSKSFPLKLDKDKTNKLITYSKYIKYGDRADDNQSDEI